MARRITFLRHGNAVAPFDGAPDKMRRLSDKGRWQVQKRREQLGNHEFDLIITSQTVRTAETALEVAGENNTAPVVMLYELFTPHSGPTKEALDRLFRKLGHAPLSAYYADDPGDVEQMKKFSKKGWARILFEIDSSRHELWLDNILIVSHGIYSACMIHEAYPEKAKCLMDLVQGECEGFVVELSDEYDDIISVTPLPPLE